MKDGGGLGVGGQIERQRERQRYTDIDREIQRELHRQREIQREREIYIYAGELLVCPPFGLQRVISLATLRVISLSTFLGGHFRTVKNRVFLRIFGMVFGPN